MAFKHVMFRAAARETVLRGATQRADAVPITLDPKSKSVLIQKKWRAPLVCNDGVIRGEESKTTARVLESVEGMQFDRAFLSPYFINNTERMEAAFEDVRILRCDHKISALKDMLPLLDQMVNFDASRKQYVDLVEAGIVDPTRVVRIALENAVSVASILLLSEATMTEIAEPRKEQERDAEAALL